MVFFRCNSGHFYSGELCPWDGWSRAGLRQALDTIRRLQAEGRSVSVDVLRASGLGEDVLKRIVIVEFGDPEAVLEAIYPKQVVVAGEIKDLLRLDRRYK
jgi:hypothetical protein